MFTFNEDQEENYYSRKDVYSALRKTRATENSMMNDLVNEGMGKISKRGSRDTSKDKGIPIKNLKEKIASEIVDEN